MFQQYQVCPFVNLHSQEIDAAFELILPHNIIVEVQQMTNAKRAVKKVQNIMHSAVF